MFRSGSAAGPHDRNDVLAVRRYIEVADGAEFCDLQLVPQAGLLSLE